VTGGTIPATAVLWSEVAAAITEARRQLDAATFDWYIATLARVLARLVCEHARTGGTS
jgi:hypothetical protein